MEVIAGVVTLCNVVLCAVIGVRLRRLAARTGLGPERWLARYFLLGALVANTLAILLYLGWSDPELALRGRAERVIHAIFLVSNALGCGALHVFTLQTFRPQSRVARAGVGLAFGLVALGILGTGFSEGFRVHVINGPFYWTAWIARMSVFPWMAIESLRYWRLLGRRAQLGLADPMLTNRFLLWGLWAVAVFALGSADPVARIAYVMITGDTVVWNPGLGLPVVHATVAFTSSVGIVAGTSLFMTFFPTTRYRRWIEGRVAAR